MPHPIPQNLRPLALDEVKRLLAAARGHPDEALMIVALATGLRRGELLAVRWQDIDVARGTLTVRHTLHLMSRDEVDEAELKTGRREIALSGIVSEVLQEHRQSLDEAKQAAGAAWQEHDLVFPRPSGGYRRPDQLSQDVRELARRADIPPLSFHALRWTTTSLLLSLGVPPQVVQEMLEIARGILPLARLSSTTLALHHEAVANLDDLFRTLVPFHHPGSPASQDT